MDFIGGRTKNVFSTPFNPSVCLETSLRADVIRTVARNFKILSVNTPNSTVPSLGNGTEKKACKMF